MNGQHTPGPWEVVSPERLNHPKTTISGRDREGSRFQTIAIIENGNANALHLIIDPEQQAANARLIAAAPDLLAALRRLVACPDVNLDELDPKTIAALDDAQAAIAKATGGAP